MPASVSDSNIQEKLKTSDKKLTVKPHETEQPRTDASLQIEQLALMLRSRHFTGDVLRVLIGRLRHPERAYTSKDLEVLLLVTLALDRAGMWP